MVKDISVVKEFSDEFFKLIESTTDIDGLLVLFKESSECVTSFTKNNDMLRDKIKAYLKQRQWTDYNDTRDKINVHLMSSTRKSLDEKIVKQMLTESDFNRATKITIFERLCITPSNNKFNGKEVRLR